MAFAPRDVRDGFTVEEGKSAHVGELRVDFLVLPELIYRE